MTFTLSFWDERKRGSKHLANKKIVAYYKALE